MKIEMIISVSNHKKGDVITLAEKKANQFIGAGFAKLYTETKKTDKPKAKPKPRRKKTAKTAS